jgi:hypothetical protein
MEVLGQKVEQYQKLRWNNVSFRQAGISTCCCPVLESLWQI